MLQASPPDSRTGRKALENYAAEVVGLDCGRRRCRRVASERGPAPYLKDTDTELEVLDTRTHVVENKVETDYARSDPTAHGGQRGWAA